MLSASCPLLRAPCFLFSAFHSFRHEDSGQNASGPDPPPRPHPLLNPEPGKESGKNRLHGKDDCGAGWRSPSLGPGLTDISQDRAGHGKIKSGAIHQGREMEIQLAGRTRPDQAPYARGQKLQERQPKRIPPRRKTAQGENMPGPQKRAD